MGLCRLLNWGGEGGIIYLRIGRSDSAKNISILLSKERGKEDNVCGGGGEIGWERVKKAASERA